MGKMHQCSLPITTKWQVKGLAKNKWIHMVVGNSALTTEYDPHKEMFMQSIPPDQCTQEHRAQASWCLLAVIKAEPTAWSIVGMLAFTPGNFPSLSLWASNKDKSLWNILRCKKRYHLVPMQWFIVHCSSEPPEVLVKIPIEGACPRPITSGSLGIEPGTGSF